MTLTEKLEIFRATLEAATLQDQMDRGFTPALHRHDCRVKIGRKYANVDVADSGKYMVELSSGRIFGIKGYGVIHRGYSYGTLDTIADWDWRGYTARKRAREALNAGG